MFRRFSLALKALVLTAALLVGVTTGVVHSAVAHASVVSQTAKCASTIQCVRVLESRQRDITSKTQIYIVKNGDTLSTIAHKVGVKWEKIYCANRKVIGSNFNIIKKGMKLTILVHPRSCHIAAFTAGNSSPPVALSFNTTGWTSNYRQAVLQFQACVIRVESGGNAQVMNASGHYGLYQFSYSTWVGYGGVPGDFGHASVAEQNSVFFTAMATPAGADNWTPYDGCVLEYS